jgi:hypothetical protein
MDSRSIGLLLVAVGVAVVLLGLLVMAGFFGWFGRLPGDVRIDGGNFRVYVPIASMILVSVVLTLVLNLMRRFF